MKLPGRKKRYRKARLALVACAVAGVGFLTWLAISAATADTDLILETKYSLPELVSLATLPEVGQGEYAVAVDGEVVATSDRVKAGTGSEAGAETEGEAASEASDGTAQRPTASTAKMILGLAVMQAKPFAKGETGKTLTMTEDDHARYVWYVSHGGSVAAVQVGEEISEYDALMAVFLASSNNMADTLAVWAFGSLEDYREYATKILTEWGITDTTIGVDASGFDASTTSTPADLARIGQKVLENPVLAEIVGEKEYTVPVAGTLSNTNTLLGQKGIVGVKTGYIGDASGYCLVAGYLEDEHIITTALLGAPTRAESFSESLDVVAKMQELVQPQQLVTAGEVVGYYDSWWTGQVAIRADEDLTGLGWDGARTETKLEMDGAHGVLKIQIGAGEYQVSVTAEKYAAEPSLGERLGHAFGWRNERELAGGDAAGENEEPAEADGGTAEATEEVAEEAAPETFTPFTNAPSSNCTIKLGALMLINPNFTVENEFIAARRGELVSLSSRYGIAEHNAYNGDNLLDAEAAGQMSAMVKAYEAENPGHTFETLSCFRAVGTSCGRLCAATGTSDHHTGLTCDLVDPAYGVSLDTSTYDAHPDWQWLKANSYKYGFIDRFPEAWAGGSMDEPLNVDENGSTGLFETWHYRYVGVGPATEIATGKYNNGQYDSLEHYLLMRGLVADLKTGVCR